MNSLFEQSRAFASIFRNDIPWIKKSEDVNQAYGALGIATLFPTAAADLPADIKITDYSPEQAAKVVKQNLESILSASIADKIFAQLSAEDQQLLIGDWDGIVDSARQKFPSGTTVVAFYAWLSRYLKQTFGFVLPSLGGGQTGTVPAGITPTPDGSAPPPPNNPNEPPPEPRDPFEGLAWADAPATEEEGEEPTPDPQTPARNLSARFTDVIVEDIVDRLDTLRDVLADSPYMKSTVTALTDAMAEIQNVSNSPGDADAEDRIDNAIQETMAVIDRELAQKNATKEERRALGGTKRYMMKTRSQTPSKAVAMTRGRGVKPRRYTPKQLSKRILQGEITAGNDHPLVRNALKRLAVGKGVAKRRHK